MSVLYGAVTLDELGVHQCGGGGGGSHGGSGLMALRVVPIISARRFLLVILSCGFCMAARGVSN